jgi:hypothetical protein
LRDGATQKAQPPEIAQSPETLLTHLVTTPGNRVKGKVPKDADINRVLRVILREETAEIRKIAKALQ